MTRFQTFAAACWGSAGAVLLLPGFIAAAHWDTSFTWWDNNISDLGEVRAPWHMYANASFVLTGLLLAIGTIAHARGVSRVLLLAGSLGYLLAGFYPADTHENPHVLGAFLIMGGGNIGLLLVSRPFGLAAIIGTVGFLALDAPILERVAAFPLLVWAGATGLSILTRVPLAEWSSLSLPRRSP
jgi:hypothetical membrane protein